MSSIEQADSSGEVPSMPRAGISLRGDNRGYLQSDFGVLNDLSALERASRIADQVIEGRRWGITRAVGRFLVSENILPLIVENGTVRPRIEAVFPTSLQLPRTNERVMILMASRNRASRKSIVPHSEMMNVTKQDEMYRIAHPVHHVARIADLRASGYRFVSRIPEQLIHSVHGLWESTFGWDLDGVRSRARSLIRQASMVPHERSVWFSGLVNPAGTLVAAATAERADMHTGKGLPPLPLVETSEWSSREEGKGLMAAANTHLMAQVLEDLNSLPVSPTIFAETNYMSKAHRAGLASGMSVAPNMMRGLWVPQILEQHVTVGDGHEPIGLRDFIPVYLPDEEKINQYNAQARSSILRSRPERTQKGGGA